MPAPAESAPRILVVATTLRLNTLAFSVPYLWLWTRELPVGDRLSATAAHALLVLTANVAGDAADLRRGVPPHIGLTRDQALTDRRLARALEPVLGVAAVVASLWLARTQPLAPVAVALAVSAVAAGARLPLSRKYLIGPEVGAPLLLLVLPAVLLAVGLGATPPPATVLAGAVFLSGLVVLCHRRDSRDDRSRGIPTVGTQFPEVTLAAPAVLGVLGLVAVAAGPSPDGALGAVQLVAAIAYVAVTVLPRGAVPAATAAHAVVALTFLAT